MRLFVVDNEARRCVAVGTEAGIRDVNEFLRATGAGEVRGMGDLLPRIHDLEALLDDESGSAVPAKLLAPVERPSKVLGVGMNYRSFVDQLGEQTPDHLSVFHKTAAALTGHGHPIVIPANTTEAVPEGELAVVIGRPALRVSEAQSTDYIAGYTCANDVSARNLEFQTSQWTAGKMLPTFCPLGPALVTPDELDDPDALTICTRLNGRVIQSGNTADMVFGIARLISELSHLVALDVGDVILTGTPSDLGALSTPIFLRSGDTVSVEIEHVGILENYVIAHDEVER